MNGCKINDEILYQTATKHNVTSSHLASMLTVQIKMTLCQLNDGTLVQVW